MLIFFKMIDYAKISNVTFEDVDHKDRPDYCDAFIASFDIDGVEATDEQIDEINEDSDLVHELLMDYLN